MYVVLVSSIATLAKRKSAELFDGIDVLIFIVLLYFLLSLSIIDEPLYLNRKIHLSKEAMFLSALYLFNMGYFFPHLPTKVITF